MKREIIDVPVLSAAVKAIGVPLSLVTRGGGLVFVSGMPPLDLATGALVKGDIAVQAEASLQALKHCLKAAGTTPDNVLMVRVYAANAGFYGAINRIYEANDERPLWVRWPLSFGLAFCLVAGIVGAALLVEAVPKQSGALEILLFLVRWIGALAALVAVTGVLVRLAPARHRPKRWASAGAVLVIATWLVTSFAFRWYVSTFANFKTAVGQLTVFIVLMAYAYASSIVLLVGIEIDELLREDASSRERGILDVLFGLGR